MNRYDWMQPSDLGIVEQIEPFLRSIPEVEQLDPERRFNLIIATMEAVSNAIVHGNNNQPTRKVELWVETDERTISVHVRDYGKGFDPDALPDPRLGENLFRDGGRGVFLMRALADNVEFIQHSPGMEVVITLYR